MTSTRLKNDNFHQQDDMRITSYAVRYYLEKPEHNCPIGFPAEPTVRLQMSGASWPQGQWKTDVESDLFNIKSFKRPLETISKFVWAVADPDPPGSELFLQN